MYGHKPVMPVECIELLDIKPDGIYVDGTIGGAGHAAQIYSRLGPMGTLIGIDQDEEAVEASKQRLKEIDGKAVLHIIKSNFNSIATICNNLGFEEVDGILFDLGVSSYQFDTPLRGFSFRNDAPLDMRMDRHGTLTAEYVVNNYNEERLRKIFYEYGEEKWAARIAKFIADTRRNKPLKTTLELVDVINAAVPKSARQEGIHPATRTFQAIRIEVNGELEVLPGTIADSMGLLKQGGRLCMITFHSLEDRCVKRAYESFVNPCVCPPDFPKCVCGRIKSGKYVGKKMIIPTPEEIESNPRSRSAKLRVIQKV